MGQYLSPKTLNRNYQDAALIVAMTIHGMMRNYLVKVCCLVTATRLSTELFQQDTYAVALGDTITLLLLYTPELS